MSAVRSILIADARATLLRELSSAVGQNDVYEAFATWLVGGAVSGLGCALSSTIAPNASRTAQSVAVLGFVANGKELSIADGEALKFRLAWLVQCDPVISGTPMPFCMDAVTLAGVILGAKWTGDADLLQKVGQWIQRCRQATVRGQGLGEWQERLLEVVGAGAGVVWQAKAADGPDSAEVRVALRSKGFGGSGDSDSFEAGEIAALNQILTQQLAILGIARAAIRLAALDWIRRVRPVSDLRSVAVPDLCNLLRRIPSGLKKWTWEDKPRTRKAPAAQRWHVDNEYHVQNLLWLLLAPIFPDLSDEVATRKVGPLQPKADLIIPSLRIIIEVKFMRHGDHPKKMIEQIAQDRGLYLQEGADHDGIVAFMWDDSCRTELHDEMIRGLLQIDGIVDAIIVPRPGVMAEKIL